jgi:anti-anti-sigma factor
MFSATSRREGSRAIVEIAGELDLTAVEPLTAALREAITEGVDTVDLDTTGVTFIDSRALAMFLAFRLNAPKEGVAMRMVATSDEFARVAEVAGLGEDLLPAPEPPEDPDEDEDETGDAPADPPG